MRSYRWPFARFAALAVLGLAAGSAPGALGSAVDPRVGIETVAVDGTHLWITVRNGTAVDHSLTVYATVLLADGTVATTTAGLHVPAGQSATAGCGFPAPVQGVIQVGVVLDDGSPL